MKHVPTIIGSILLVIAFGVYLYGICCAIARKNLDSNYNLNEPLNTLTATIDAILLTNLGAVLGYSVAKPDSALAYLTLLGNTNKNMPSLSATDNIQIIASIIYLIVLIACFITWAIKKFSPDAKEIAPLVIQNSKALIGVITAYLAFALSVKQA
jgi:hypothetical protein